MPESLFSRTPAKRFVATDAIGTRTLVAAETVANWVGDPVGPLLKYEALTGTRLRDGGDPVWFLTFHGRYESAAAKNPGAVTFADYCRRLAPDRVDVLESESKVRTLPPKAHEISVNIAGLTITIDGVEHDAKSAQSLRWVAVLVAHAGEWISAPELYGYDKELLSVRTNRLRGYLPTVVHSLIETHRSKGSRIVLTMA